MTQNQHQAARNALNEIRSLDYHLRAALKDVDMPFGTAERLLLNLAYLNNRATELDTEFPPQYGSVDEQ